MPHKFKVGDRVKVRASANSKFSGMTGKITLRRADRSYWVRFFDGDSVFWFGEGELEAAPSCGICEDEGTVICAHCNGSGEGMADGSTCQTCKGKGEVPCECQDERLKDEADAKAAAEEDACDARRDDE